MRLLYKAVPQPAPHASTGQDWEINLRVRARLFLCRIISFFILHIFGKGFARQHRVLFHFHFRCEQHTVAFTISDTLAFTVNSL